METVQSEYMHRLGVTPRILMEMENMEAIKSLVAAGLGTALMPLCCVSGVHGRGITYKKIRGMPMSRKLLIAALDWKAHPPATRRLAGRILKALSNPKELKEARRVIDQIDELD